MSQTVLAQLMNVLALTNKKIPDWDFYFFFFLLKTFLKVPRKLGDLTTLSFPK